MEKRKDLTRFENAQKGLYREKRKITEKRKTWLDSKTFKKGQPRQKREYKIKLVAISICGATI